LAADEIENHHIWKFCEITYDSLIKHAVSTSRGASEVDFQGKSTKTKDLPTTNNSGKPQKTSPEPETKRYKPRKSPLYHNAKLEAPDGQRLCVCDTKKAAWYVAKGIGSYVDEEKLTVRLNFEPSGRPRGPAADYYLSTKNNCCVVCSKDDSYCRKYIVPHEYRRHFPKIMRNHQSHDILLMCIPCHQLGGFYDFSLRQKLGEMCNAPISDKDDTKLLLDMDAKKVKAAARALVNSRNEIPYTRVKELESIVKCYFNTKELNEELLKEASNMDSYFSNENYVPHGKKVVDYFVKENGEEKGIQMIEQMWRRHFLETMKPKFLPPLWSVEHRQDWKFDMDVNSALKYPKSQL